MKKVLIISYFYPPANFVGAERTAAWAKYLSESGYYPIILTRCWNEGQSDPIEKVVRNEETHESFESYEVYRIPVKRTLRDRCYGNPRLKYIQKVLTFMELFLSGIFIKALPYSGIYQKAKTLLKQDKEILAVIASGSPFQSFFIGYQLKKEFDILWIPDYRDEWNTLEKPTVSKGLWKFLRLQQKYNELKWTSNADAFVTVSEKWRDSIAKFINKSGFVVKNGYEKLKVIDTNNVENITDKLSVIYAGTLYPSQHIEIFIDACIRILKSNPTDINIHFIGINILPDEENRVKSLIAGFEQNFLFSKRVERSSLDNYVANADLLFLTAFENTKGWYPVKLYEYYASGKAILLCPGDGDVMDEFVRLTNSGFIANSVKECEEILRRCIDKKKKKERINFERNIAEGEKFSRKYQTKVLAEILDKLTEQPN